MLNDASKMLAEATFSDTDSNEIVASKEVGWFLVSVENANFTEKMQ